jgi:hypothetical protein
MKFIQKLGTSIKKASYRIYDSFNRWQRTFSKMSIPNIQPDSKFKIGWDLVHLICIIFLLIYLPIELIMEVNFRELYGH